MFPFLFLVTTIFIAIPTILELVLEKKKVSQTTIVLSGKEIANSQKIVQIRDEIRGWGDRANQLYSNFIDFLVGIVSVFLLLIFLRTIISIISFIVRILPL